MFRKGLNFPERFFLQTEYGLIWVIPGTLLPGAVKFPVFLQGAVVAFQIVLTETLGAIGTVTVQRGGTPGSES